MRNGNNTRARTHYRRDVFCHTCERGRWFRFDTGHWVCCVCQFVERVAGGELAPDPWEASDE